MIALIENGEGDNLVVENILGLKMFRVKLPSENKVKVRKMKKILKETTLALRENEVRRVCYHRQFTKREYFEAHGLIEVNGRRLYENLAAEIAIRSEGRCAAFIADRLLPIEEQNLLRLCESFRYMLIYLKHGCEEICNVLRNSLGIVVTQLQNPQQIQAADVIVCLSAPPWHARLSDKCTLVAADLRDVQCISGGKRAVSVALSMRDNKVKYIPDGYDASAILSEALIHGTVKKDELCLDKIRFE